MRCPAWWRLWAEPAGPPNIDRPSFSLISNLGLWDPGAGLPFAEVSRACPPDFLERPDLKGLPVITASDAHYLDQIMDACQQVELPKKILPPCWNG